VARSRGCTDLPCAAIARNGHRIAGLAATRSIGLLRRSKRAQRRAAQSDALDVLGLVVMALGVGKALGPLAWR
jgi:hypothetical protein